MSIPDPGKIPGRGAVTRASLITAAIEVFGRDGYDAASTRAIARSAGANQALIGYHFGGKQGLYLAVFEQITARMAATMLPVGAAVSADLEALEPLPNPQTARDLGRDGIERIFFAFTGMLAQPESAGWIKMILREQQEPTDAFNVIFVGMMEPMLSLLTRLVALGTGLDAAGEEARLRAFMLLGQVLVFVVARSTANRYLGWSGFDDGHSDAIRAQLKQCIAAQLNRDDSNDRDVKS